MNIEEQIKEQIEELRNILNNFLQDVDTKAEVDADVANTIVDVYLKKLTNLLTKSNEEAYKKGREDMETELTRNVLLDGEPRNYTGMDTPDGKLSKKYEELLTQQSLDKGK